ncbi:MAG: FAD-binding oxidoreductase [Sneathiella sp.]
MPSPSYPSYLRPCNWPTTTPPLHGRNMLAGNHDCDALVIGAGFTGIAIARKLSEINPLSRICLLDAESVGEGSSGRNSGFVLEHAFGSLNPEKTSRIYRLFQQAHSDLMGFAHPSTPKTDDHIFKAAATRRGEKALIDLASYFRASGQPHKPMTASELKEITGSSYYLSGISIPGNRLANPVDLVLSAARNLPKNIILYENSPVLSLEKTSSGWKAQTKQGSLKAPKVFLGNNAFVKNLGFGQSRSITIFTYAGITPVLDTEERIKTSSSGQWGLLPAHRLGTTFRTTEDGRLLVRGMYGYEKESANKTEQTLSQSLRKRFPNLKSAQHLESWWGGTTSLTANSAPLWGELQAGLYCSSGCNGVGIVKGWLLGTALASQAYGQNSIDVPDLFGSPTWIPPEPFRKLGFLAASTYEKRLASDEK